MIDDAKWMLGFAALLALGLGAVAALAYAIGCAGCGAAEEIREDLE